MARALTIDFPLIEAAYTEEFGEIDPQVYEIGKALWESCAEGLADRILRDPPAGMRLMLKAVAEVSRARRNNPSQIKNVRAYLYRSYKNLLLVELERENCRRRILDGWQQSNDNLPQVPNEEEINRKILVNEIRRRMNEWTRAVFDFHSLGYTFEEMASHFGSPANVIRSRYSKNLARLARQINAELEEIDRLFY